MKKNIFKTGLLLFALLLNYSCNDDFLERFPLDRISNETFWNTENDLKVYNNSLYNLARNDNDVPILMAHDDGFDSNNQSYWYLDEMTDNIAPREARHIFYQRIRAGKHTIPSNPDMFGWRNGGWTFIRACNIGLDNYSKAKIPQATIDKYAGEARLFRGWYYADMVSKYGDFPYVDHELTTESEELYGPRTPRDEVMQNVLADLNFACEKLPANWGDGQAPGRINRWAALLVKSRLCLFEGTWRKYHGLSGHETWLTEALNAAQELIEDGPYKLYTSGDMAHAYNAIHRMTDLSGNPEVIYWRRYQLGVFTNHVQSYHAGYNGGATRNMVEDYLCTDGLPITLSPLYKGDAVYEDIFENRDPRLRQTILHPADQPYYIYGNHEFSKYPYPRIQGMSGGRMSTTGYHIIKVYDNSAAVATYNTSSTPGIVLRFAEALLNFAEAKAELGTITQADLDISINLLRDRVGMVHMDLANIPVDPRYTGDGVSPLLVEIRRERRVELFMEGFRYNDLRRWKQGKKLLIPSYGMRWDETNRTRVDPTGKATIKSSVDPVSGIEYLDIYKGTDFAVPEFVEAKHYFWPVPLSVISQNPAITQNPGWD